MISAETKSQRLMQLEQLLLAHPEGLRRSAIARRLGVHRATAARYVTDLSGLIPLTESDDGVIGIDRSGYLNNIRVTVHESLALYLGCRFVADHTDRFNPHAASALRKLGSSLRSFAPTIASHILSEAERLDGPLIHRDATWLSVLEILTRAWSDGQFARVVHHSVRRNADDEYLIAVYLILPHAAGQTLQVVGKCRGEVHLRTLRIDRILQASLTSHPAPPPQDGEVESALKNAWGIWSSDSEPVDVVLRFSARVAYRVRETTWHPSQALEDLSDGRVLWRARIAEPREMYPWIRSWGADAEVLAPEDLRRRIREEAAALSALYSTDD